MATRVYVRRIGDGEAAKQLDGLINETQKHGFGLAMNDPVKVVQGDGGRLVIELPDGMSDEVAQSEVMAILEVVAGAADVFEIWDGTDAG